MNYHKVHISITLATLQFFKSIIKKRIPDYLIIIELKFRLLINYCNFINFEDKQLNYFILGNKLLPSCFP